MTSTSSTAPTRRAWTCPPARTGRCVRSGCLSAMNAVQGSRVRVIDPRKDAHRRARWRRRCSRTRPPWTRFADSARPILSKEIPEIWATRLSHGGASRQEGRAWHHPAELKRRHAFLLHQCARHGVGGADERDRHRDAAISATLLGDRAAPPRRRISMGRQSAVGANRHRADQRQLVRAQAQASGGPRHL